MFIPDTWLHHNSVHNILGLSVIMSEAEHKGSVQHTPAEWTSSNQDQYVNADKARYNSEKVSGLIEMLV